MKLPLFRANHSIAALAALSIAFLSPVWSAPALAAEDVSYTQTIAFEDEFEDFANTPAKVSGPQFGPFVVKDAATAEVHGVIDGTTPAAFRRMIATYPDLRTLRIVDCPGSEDDEANLALSRMVRHAGLDTHVPSHGSVRSGGVELFLAGKRRTADSGAEFGVHSWADEDGLEADDYAANDPVHASYINYYIDMGLTPETARAFYAFTNKAAPHDGVYYMKPRELAAFGIVN